MEDNNQYTNDAQPTHKIGPHTPTLQDKLTDILSSKFVSTMKEQPILKMLGLVGEAYRGQLGPEWSIAGIPSSPGAGAATLPRVAPKRAANELSDLLLGRSKRVPTPDVYKPLSEGDASLEAMLWSRTNSLPPAPTRIEVPSGDPILKHITKVLPRDPAIAPEFAKRQRILGGSPTKLTSVSVSTRGTSSGAGASPYRTAYAKNKDRVSGVVREAGSVHAAGLKPLTQKEIKSLMEGPVKAFQRGVMSHSEMRELLNANRAKIAASNKDFTAKDWELYQQAMERAILAKRK